MLNVFGKSWPNVLYHKIEKKPWLWSNIKRFIQDKKKLIFNIMHSLCIQIQTKYSMIDLLDQVIKSIGLFVAWIKAGTGRGQQLAIRNASQLVKKSATSGRKDPQLVESLAATGLFDQRFCTRRRWQEFGSICFLELNNQVYYKTDLDFRCFWAGYIYTLKEKILILKCLLRFFNSKFFIQNRRKIVIFLCIIQVGSQK